MLVLSLCHMPSVKQCTCDTPFNETALIKYLTKINFNRVMSSILKVEDEVVGKLIVRC